MSEHADLEISLRPYDAGSYAVDIRFSHAGGDADVHPVRSVQPLARFDFKRLRELELDVPAYGHYLTKSLFDNSDVYGDFAQARSSALTAEAPLRLHLIISPNAPELQILRWETLLDPVDASPLCTSERVLFSRYLSSGDWRPVRLRPKGRLRALVVIANPIDLARYKPGGRELAPVDVPEELARARAGLGPIPISELASNSRATLANMLAQLREGYDILYIVAHGALLRGAPYLWLENETGGVAVTRGDDLAAQIRELRQAPWLVILVSCQSASVGHDDPLKALGPRLAEAGIPAVLAMQGDFSMDTAAVFVPSFFKELQRDGQIEQAVAVARRAVRDRRDAWMPVLFTRLKSGRLWYVPGFADDKQGFKRWPSLLNSIAQGNCTAILGAGLLEPLLGPMNELAKRWADTYEFPLEPHEREDLPQVTQYLAVNQDSRFPRDKLAEYLRNEIVRRFGSSLPMELRDPPSIQLDALIEAAGKISRERNAAEPHRVLAELPFSIYLTTNPDNLLEAALSAAGRVPHIVICPWNDYVERTLETYDDEPDAQHPLVYHLFGRLREPDSLVLTEDDYFDFLIGVTRNNNLIPDVVRGALADTALLFLGFRMDEWSFRVLFRTLMSQQGRTRRSHYTHVAVQINPEEGRILAPERARQYLEGYFQGAKISIYWGSVEDFIQELRKQLTAASTRGGDQDSSS